MSQMGKNVIKLVALGFAAAVVVGITEVAVEAAVGDVLWTVNIPSGAIGTEGAQCTGGSSGSAVAVVPGGKLNFPKFQSLLVTSCVVGSPGEALLPGSVEPIRPRWSRPLTPVSRWTAGWESLALRSDKVDLIGCGMVGGSPKIYSIDFNKIHPQHHR